MSHTEVAAGTCATCHNGTMATGKPANHVVTTAACDTCHKSTTTWTGAMYDHTGVAPGSCATCHNGTTALGKPANHIPTTQPCDLCHKSYTAFGPGTRSEDRRVGQGWSATWHNV